MNNLPTYLLTYSPGDNAKGGMQMFRAETDADAHAIADRRVPEGTVAYRLERITGSSIIVDGAYPQPVIEKLTEIAQRFAPAPGSAS